MIRKINEKNKVFFTTLKIALVQAGTKQRDIASLLGIDETNISHCMHNRQRLIHFDEWVKNNLKIDLQKLRKELEKLN